MKKIFTKKFKQNGRPEKIWDFFDTEWEEMKFEKTAEEIFQSIKKKKRNKKQLIVSKKCLRVESLPRLLKAKIFAAISGNKTLLPEVIEQIKKLGYNLTTDGEDMKYKPVPTLDVEESQNGPTFNTELRGQWKPFTDFLR